MSDMTAQPVPVKAEPSGFLGFTRAQTIGLVVMLAAIAVLPYIVYPIFLMRILTIALFACAFNLVIGYVGLLSIGHAIFWGMGAYLAGYALKFWEIDAVLAILIGGVVGAAFGLVMGFLAIRAFRHVFRDDYAGAGTDGVFRLRAGALHRRRKRHAADPTQHCFRRRLA